MNRRSFLYMAGISTIAGCGKTDVKTGKKTEPKKDAPPDRPNILWITVEDMSPNLGCYGDKYATSPNIDKLAKESVRYTNAFASAPVCSPARSCLITGVYATSMGTQHLRSSFPIPSLIRGFPAYLRQAGYYCTNNVKTDYNTSDIRRLISESWDQCSNRAHWRGKKKGQKFFSIFNNMITHQSRSMVWPYEKFKKDVQSRVKADVRHDPAKAPISPYYPDTPIVRRTVARYYDCISAMDRDTGDILAQLKEDGLDQDTIVFFYSDHGAGLPRHKRLIMDSGLRIPLLVRFPEKYKHLAPAGPGQTVDRMVSFVDFAPTILSILGLKIPDYMEGQPFLGKAETGIQPRDCIFGARDRVDEAYDMARCVRDNRYLYIRNYMPHLSYNQPSYYSDLGEIRDEITAIAERGGLKTEAQKHYAGPNRAIEELYDTKEDPHQIHNLIYSASHRGILNKMRVFLRAWLLKTHDLGFLPEIEVTRRSRAATPYQAKQKKEIYPFERILDAAELVGKGRRVVSRQIELLADPDAAVRYWAALGLLAGGEGMKEVIDALMAAKKDSSHPVRITAAWALCRLGRDDSSLKLLEKEMLGDDLQVVLLAARALELLGEKARPALPSMKKVLQKVGEGGGDERMFIRFSLDTAIKKLI